MKKTPLKKVSKQSNAKLKKKLWEVFSKYIRTRDRGICFTCGRRSTGLGYHAGHFISKAVGGLVLYFHEENVRGQCYHCNINLGGNFYIFGQKLGEEKCKELYKLKGQIVKDFDFESKIKEYEEKLKNYDTSRTS